MRKIANVRFGDHVVSQHGSRRSFLATTLTAAALSGCASIERLPPAAPSLTDRTTVLGIPNARFYADTQGAEMVQDDAVRIYAISRRDGVDYNLAFIGADFTAEHKVPFDHAYMRALFDYGYRQGRAGYRWRKAPPILEVPAGS